MKIVLVHTPKFFGPILRKIFGVERKKDK
ncbi:MAG: stage V sporulation protein SpoVM [Clostridia bacterium]|nr:stage V sporulation protein SpoVM [Clostridia bacterium]MBQ7376022.1 stage V sporulation protein SpoVM [Clostridia bacterium]